MKVELKQIEQVEVYFYTSYLAAAVCSLEHDMFCSTCRQKRKRRRAK